MGSYFVFMHAYVVALCHLCVCVCFSPLFGHSIAKFLEQKEKKLAAQREEKKKQEWQETEARKAKKHKAKKLYARTAGSNKYSIQGRVRNNVSPSEARVAVSKPVTKPAKQPVAKIPKSSKLGRASQKQAARAKTVARGGTRKAAGSKPSARAKSKEMAQLEPKAKTSATPTINVAEESQHNKTPVLQSDRPKKVLPTPPSAESARPPAMTLGNQATFTFASGEENAIPYSPELNKTTKGPFSGDRGRGTTSNSAVKRTPLGDSTCGNKTVSLVGLGYESPATLSFD